MNWIDTHAHLYLDEFKTDLEQVIHKIKSKGISSVILPNVDGSTIDPLMQLCKQWPDLCYPTIGLHPCSVTSDYKKDIQFLETYISKEKFYAIGEIGIDLYWDVTWEQQQKEALHYQIELAKEHRLPIIVHTRNSFDITFQIIQSYSDLEVVFHCFPGTADQAKKAIDKGYYIGIGGVATFKNAHDLHQTIKEIPLSSILLETDAPYLSPVPHRGKRNDSSLITIIGQRIAEIKNVTLEEVASVTHNNATHFFKIESNKTDL